MSNLSIRAMLLATTMSLCGIGNAAEAQSLPTGGQVAAGDAAITTAGPVSTISQSSARAVIDWSSFSVAQGNSIVFAQPDAYAATLNRVTGSTPSTIAGQIVSNGAVYLINPNGIAITSTGTVNTAGGFVASSLDIANSDFMGGTNRFVGKGASAKVSNDGRISADQGSYVALLGGSIANSGTISVPLGRIGLASAEMVALDINGGNFMQVGMPSATLASTLIDQSGRIEASGGMVILTAATLKGAVRNVINLSGAITADSATGSGGHITLFGGDGGTVIATGTLSARATGASGDGGFIETSGAHVDLNGLSVDAGSANGVAGTWLIDPVDFTVARVGGDLTGAQLTASLATGNVVIKSSQGASGSKGDININDTVSWSRNSLTLDAYHDININAVASATGTAGFVGITGDTAGNGVSTGGALNVALTDRGFGGRLDLAATSTFRLNGTPYVIITTLGAPGSMTGTDLQGINGDLTRSYVLGANIDATATSGWNGGAGFTPIGTDGAGTIINHGLGLNADFDGLGHVITGLTINRPTANYVGLIGYQNSAFDPFNGIRANTIRNTGIIGGQITGHDHAGGLGGFVEDVVNDYSKAKVVGNDYVGGLSGSISSSTNSWAGGDVTGSSEVGGLAGENGGDITDSHATGNVNATAIDNLGGTAGGLIASAVGRIARSYATGNVSGYDFVGGLIGFIDGFNAGIDQTYSTGNVAGHQFVGGIIGSQNLHRFNIANSSASGSINGINHVGGIAGAFFGSISNALFVGSIKGGSEVGAIVGGTYVDTFSDTQFVTEISHSYWDSDKAGVGLAVGTGLNTLADVTGYTTAQLQDFTTRASIYKGWDFATFWIPPNQAGQAGIAQAYYPTLRFAQEILVTIDSYSRSYGQPNPPLTYTITGLRAGDALVTTPTLFTLADITSNVGAYAITGSGTRVTYAGGNARVNYIDGTLTVGQAALVALGGTVSKVYDGTTVATLSPANFVLSGFANGEGATINQTVGSYATANAGTGIVVTVRLTPGNFIANAGTNLGNYSLPSSASGAVGVITPAPLMLTYLATPATSIYGTTPTGLGGSYSVTGLLGADTVAGTTGGTLSFTTSATGAAGVGSYAINGAGIVSTNGNYTITAAQAAANAAALTITPRALTLTPGLLNSIYGNAPPTSDTATDTSNAANSGLVNGDTVSSITVSTNATGASSIGRYNLTGAAASFASGSAANYRISFTTAGNALTITPRPISITAIAATRLFGLPDPAFGYTVGGNGLVNGDTLSGALATTATTLSIPGLYPINRGTLAASANYVVTSFTPGTLTVLPSRPTQDCYVIGGDGTATLCRAAAIGTSLLTKPLAPIVSDIRQP